MVPLSRMREYHPKRCGRLSSAYPPTRDMKTAGRLGAVWGHTPVRGVWPFAEQEVDILYKEEWREGQIQVLPLQPGGTQVRV